MLLRHSLQRVLRTCVLVIAATLGGLQAGAVSPNGAAVGGKAHPLKIERGVLTVDGLTVKTGLNLRVTGLRYLFIYLPGAGTAVVSEQPFAGAREEKAAFHGNSLTVFAGERVLQLTAANHMRSTRSAFVRFDRGAGPGLRLPALSYGDSAVMPAVWQEEASPLSGGHTRVRARGRRAMRSAKLCRPSPRGREVCATVREIVYKP